MLLALAGCAQRSQREVPEDVSRLPEQGEAAEGGEVEVDPLPAPAAPAQRRRRLPRARPQEGDLEAYRARFAQHIAESAASQIFDGPPPALLRSVVVLSLVVDAAGSLTGARVLRDNGDAEAVRIALASVRNAAPFPALPSGLARRGRTSVVETWLFRSDGRFQLRSLSTSQQRSE